MMNQKEILKKLLDCYADELEPDSFLMAPEQSQEAVEALKGAADKYWGIDPNCSLKFANRIIKIGEVNEQKAFIARGKMARGDALKYFGDLEQAWQEIADAEALFIESGDEVSAATTWIGRLFICLDVQRSDEALENAKKAFTTFLTHSEYIKLTRLQINKAIIHDLLGEYAKALDVYKDLLLLVEKIENPDKDYRPIIYSGMATSYGYLGDFSKSLEYFDKAYDLFIADGQHKRATITEYNKGYALQTLGRFTEALKNFRKLEALSAGEITRDAAYARRSIVECYLLMNNRHLDAYQLAQNVVEEFQQLNAQFEVARSLGYLAVAEANLGKYDDALQTLSKAEAVFTTLDSKLWLALTYIRSGRIYFQQQRLKFAEDYAQRAIKLSEEFKSEYLYALAKLLYAEVVIQQGDPNLAGEIASEVLRIGKNLQIPTIQYRANVVLGKTKESLGFSSRALQYYQNALDMLDELQRYLTINLRAGFLEDKQEALHGVMRLRLASEEVEEAFQVLEMYKSQVILQYLFNPDRMKWLQSSHSLLETLDGLRAEYHGLFHYAYDDVVATELETEQHLIRRANKTSRINDLEIKIRQTVEQLYLNSEEKAGYNTVDIPSLTEIQSKLSKESMLIEFFSDGEQWYVFTITVDSITCSALSFKTSELMQHLDAFRANLNHALHIYAETSDLNDSRLTVLTKRIKNILNRLYRGLFSSIALSLDQYSQLIIVPYKELHYIPFNLIYTGENYFIQNHEVIVLPTASLLAGSPQPRPKGAMSIAYSGATSLANVDHEAQKIQAAIGGLVFMGAKAVSKCLSRKPCQVLHIAAHGAYRIDAPEFSYIELADGRIYMDDLLQNDLSYELVTLSACETGRASVLGADELIGLGRGFLLAGTQALIVSLWRVEDFSTSRLMEQFYSHLLAGDSKSTALRRIQIEILQDNPTIHPLLWGAFQLIGNPQPLSI